MKKKFGLLTLIVVLLVSAAGTFGVNAQDATLTIWADETRASKIEEIGAAFTDEYGVAINVQQLTFSDIRGEFITAAPAGEGPDLIIGAHDWVGELVSNGLLAPVDLSEDIRGHLNPGGLDAFVCEGDLYGLPYAVSNPAFFRNVDLVPDAPTTWDEVRAISEELAADEIYGYLIQMRDPWHSYTVMSAFGGYVFGFEPGVGYDPEDVGLDSEGSIAAYEYLGNLIKDGLMPAGLDQETMWALFTEGKGAMMVTGPWALETLDASDVNYAISIAPEGPGGPPRPFLSVDGFMVSAFAADPQLAQIFLSEFIATDDGMQALFDAQPRPPTWDGVAVDDPSVASFTEAAQYGAPQPAIPEMGAVWESWANMMELSLTAPANAAAEAANAAEQVRTAIAEAGN